MTAPEGRFTLTPADPVMAESVANSRYVFYVPRFGNLLPLYDGAGFVLTQFANIVFDALDPTKSPGAVGPNEVHDFYGWKDSDGTLRHAMLIKRYRDQDYFPSLAMQAVRDFASTYYVGSRVLKPLLARLADRPEQIANPLCELNRWLSLLPAAGDYGTQKLFVFRKMG